MSYCGEFALIKNRIEMTTEKKVQKLKANGWNVVFNVKDAMHVADRGCIKYSSKSITSLYKSIKNDISQ